MEKRYKDILFDLDGTLTDSEQGVIRSVQYALKKFGIESSAEELKTFIGPPLYWSFENYYGFSRAKALQAVDYYREYFREKGIFENELYPSIPEMLHKLDQNGKKLHVATSKPTVFAEKVLQHFKLAHYFATIAGSNLDGSRIEKGDIIEFVLERNRGIEKKEAVMVGDRKHDILGAQSCGLDSIAVTYGYGSVEELTAAEPTHISNSVEELTELLLDS